MIPMKNAPKLAIVVPCYNEEAVLADTNVRLVALVQDLIGGGLVAADSFILYVNDGSQDATWPTIEALHEQSRLSCGVNLAANVGHQNALVAGLSVAVEKADVIVSIDADLQDDETCIREMLRTYQSGSDIVYGVRRSRQTDTWFKRNTALAFYSLMRLLGVKSVYNHADYRLMSQRAVRQLLCYRERNLFLRGLVPLVGYETASVYYDRSERMAGKSKYPLAKMIAFAFDGITSFSVKLVHVVLYLGIVFLLVSLWVLGWVLTEYYMTRTVPGWSSLMLSVWFCSGCVLIAIGIIGEYIGKIYIEVKDRPRFNIEKMLFE